MAVAIQDPIGGERRRFTVDEYYRMAEAGILRPDDRVELLDGEVVWMSPIGILHAAVVEWAHDHLQARLGRRAQVRSQNPASLSLYDEPQPDLMLVAPRADYYLQGHPAPADALLVIEVADTSLDSDRRKKLPRYAATGVREVWLLDLQAEHLEVYREPLPEEQRYAQHRRYAAGERLAPEALPDLVVAVEELLPGTPEDRQRARDLDRERRRQQERHRRPARARERGRARGWDLGL